VTRLHYDDDRVDKAIGLALLVIASATYHILATRYVSQQNTIEHRLRNEYVGKWTRALMGLCMILPSVADERLEAAHKTSRAE
jgi:hypothetical protein